MHVLSPGEVIRFPPALRIHGRHAGAHAGDQAARVGGEQVEIITISHEIINYSE